MRLFNIFAKNIINMKSAFKISILFLILLSLSSCFINRTTVGNGPIGKDVTAVKYSKRKQMYVLWGLMSLKPREAKLPVDCGYQIKTSFNGIDAVVSVLTLGIFSMRTEKVMVIKNSPCDPKIIKQENKLQYEEMHQGK